MPRCFGCFDDWDGFCWDRCWYSDECYWETFGY